MLPITISIYVAKTLHIGYMLPIALYVDNNNINYTLHVANNDTLTLNVANNCIN
jgi:hypothetical protein